MRGKLHKGLLIVGIAIITGLFFQFSFDNRPISEQEFVFKPSPPPFLRDSSVWADSIFHSLSLEEAIGQLFMVAAYPNNGMQDMRRVANLIKKHKVGGIIFFQGQPEDIARLARYYQSISEVPLLIAIDGEWGPSMRLDNTLVYPRQMMLGAINDNDILYQMGRDIAKQLKLLGIHVNFAPVIDVNNNPDNPVIGSRSFGESRENVARKGFLYMRGMQDEGIMAVAKHFPGHGDTDKDSHHELPVISHPRTRLDSMELFPFQALIDGGVGGVMMAHLSIPGLDSTKNKPSTLSPLIADSLLKKEMKFKGLVFTDAMNMRGVSDLYEPTDANVLALGAGNDILLMPADEDKSIAKIVELAKDSNLLRAELNSRCLKVLKAKEWCVKPVLKDNYYNKKALLDSLNSDYFELNRRRLIEKSLTVVSNPEKMLPIKHLEKQKIALVQVGDPESAEFTRSLNYYTAVDPFLLNEETDILEFAAIYDSIQKNYNQVIVALHAPSFRANRQYGISDQLIIYANKLLSLPSVIVTAFSSPYLLTQLKALSKEQAIIVAYENNAISQSMAAQLIFGAIPADGHLPVGINSTFKAGTGLEVKSLGRFKYTLPLEAGLDKSKFYKIDSIIADAIGKKAMPGCQVLVARNGQVIMNKAYGYFTYDRYQEVTETDLYDIASLTKIIATVPSIMFLEDEEKIQLNKPLGDYLPELDTTNKSKMKIEDVLLHQAGLQSWIPFYQNYLEPVYPNQKFASSRYSSQYPIQIGRHFFVNKHIQYTPESFSRKQEGIYTNEVAKGLFMNPVLADSIYLAIYASELGKKKYRYSDLGFYLFQHLIEQLGVKPLDKFVDSVFYQSLGATTLGYKPLEHFPLEQITPTENDLVFRKQIVQGYVHDPGAAMLGGVAGHAGLFSNANDLAKMVQMYLNKGNYGGVKYLNEETVEKYTSCVECRNGNRRGLGFDKPEPDTTKNGPAFKGISLDSYGHTGFTGTMVWADPSTGILYIFLSNRVFPDAVSNKLAEMDVRTNIQKVIYEAIIE